MGGPRRANNALNLIPPPQFTRSNLGTEREPMMIKMPLAAADVATLEAVETAMATGGLTSNDCVASVYFNKSSIAADVTDPDVPVAAASQRYITRVSGFHVQGHSTATSVHLGGGKKRYSATNAYQRLMNARETESHLERGIYHTRKLFLPNKADLENQKGFKLISAVPPGFGSINVEYAHVGDFLFSVGSSSSVATGTKATIDIGFTVHSTPNPDYVENSAVIQPPQMIIVTSNDPSLILQGFNDGPSETTLITATEKEIQLRNLDQGRFSVTTNLVNLVPRPAANRLYKLNPPLQIPRSTGGPTYLSFIKLAPESGDSKVSQLKLYEGLVDSRLGFNKGVVNSLSIKIPSGLKLEPFIDLDVSRLDCMNHQSKPYSGGDRLIRVSARVQRPTRLSPIFDSSLWEDEDFSVIDDNASLLDAKNNLDTINNKLRRVRIY